MAKRYTTHYTDKQRAAYWKKKYFALLKSQKKKSGWVDSEGTRRYRKRR